MSSKIAKNIVTILCDDIRQEVGNKDSLMGVYHEDIIFDKLPNFMQRLSIAAYFTKLNFSVSKCEIVLTLPDHEPKIVPLDHLPKAKEGENLKVHFTAGHLQVTKPGDAKIEIILNGDKKTKAVHKFAIKLRNT